MLSSVKVTTMKGEINQASRYEVYMNFAYLLYIMLCRLARNSKTAHINSESAAKFLISCSPASLLELFHQILLL